MVVSISDTVADEVCEALKQLQRLGGELKGIEMKRSNDDWMVIISIRAPSEIGPGDQVVNRNLIVESFDVAQAVATAVAGRYGCLGKAG